MPKTPIYYDDPKFDYQDYWWGRVYEDKSEKQVLKKLLGKIRKKGKILDAGGGFGRLAGVYAPFFKNCILIDSSQKLLKDAHLYCRKYNNLTIKRGFIEKLPFKNFFFDAVISIRTFHHLEDPNRAIKEISRVTKPGGFFILEFANKTRFKNIIRNFFSGNLNFFTEISPVDIAKKKNSAPFFSYHPSQIKTLLATNGFEIKEIVSVCNFRSQILKKIFPTALLLWFDLIIYFLNTRSELLNYFGPSIFVLSRKT